MSSVRTLPSPVRQSPAAARAPSFWMSGPQNALLKSTILKPLNSDGLCEPVTMMPASVPSSRVA